MEDIFGEVEKCLCDRTKKKDQAYDMLAFVNFMGGTQIPRSSPTELMFICGTAVYTNIVIPSSVGREKGKEKDREYWRKYFFYQPVN